MPRRPSPTQTRRSLKVLIDSAAGYKIDRREELAAIVAVGNSTFPALMRAFQKLPRRDDDHLRVGVIVTRLTQPGFLAQAKAELATLDAAS
jgi:hypothetical protein